MKITRHILGERHMKLLINEDFYYPLRFLFIDLILISKTAKLNQ